MALKTMSGPLPTATQKPLLFAAGTSAYLNAEWTARFGCTPGGGAVIPASIGWGKGAAVRAQLKKDRTAGRVSAMWLHMPLPFMQKPGFHPSQLVTHADTLDYTAALNEHCAAGGLAVVTLLDEIEQHLPFGPAVYVQTYDAIGARLPTPAQGCFLAWEKAPFVAPVKYGKMTWADWRPKLPVFRGYHAHGDNVLLGTPRGDDTQRFLDETRNMGFAGVVVMDGGYTGGDPIVSGKFTGNVCDPAMSVPWLVAHLRMLEENEVLFSVAPNNTNNWSVAHWLTGRYVPGPHEPPGNMTAPAWPGCPEFCEVLGDYLKLPRVLHAGDPKLAVAMDAMKTGMGGTPGPGPATL